jgi:quinol monooxygenase YgiN
VTTVITSATAHRGAHTYTLHRGTEDPSLFIFYENWTSAEHLDAQPRGPAPAGFLPKIPDLIDGELVINRVRRIA